jgi:hypothetical protein
VLVDLVACDRWEGSAVINGWCSYSWNFHVPSEDAVSCCGHENRYFLLSGWHLVEVGNRIHFAFVDGDWHFEDGKGSLLTIFDVSRDAGAVHLKVLRCLRREVDDRCFVGAVFPGGIPETLVSGWEIMRIYVLTPFSMKEHKLRLKL